MPLTELPHDIAGRHAMAPEKFLKFPSDSRQTYLVRRT
jgi:hypothetical protein